MKDFIRWMKSSDGIFSAIGGFLIGVGFGFKVGLGIMGIILIHNLMAKGR
jgi:hypothetical protein